MQDSLLSRADDALYQAKARGKNRVVAADSTVIPEARSRMPNARG
jgi:predicted signal transduction protein with EAL and GGDEF domain